MTRDKNDARQKIAAAFRSLAGWIPGDGGRPHTEPLVFPILVGEGTSEPAVLIAERLVARSGRDTVIVEAELRGRLPRFEMTVARAHVHGQAHSAYRVWLSPDAGTLWLLSAYLPQPDIPFYRLDAGGLHVAAALPWIGYEDRILGQRHAELVLARLMGHVA